MLVNATEGKAKGVCAETGGEENETVYTRQRQTVKESASEPVIEGM